MTRRELRDSIFKLLFALEFHLPGEEETQFALMQDLFEDSFGNIREEDRIYMSEKFKHIRQHLEEIDTAVNEVSKGWKTSRMAKVDLNLIRLAVYEIRYEEEIPAKVAVNEAVELAKIYGTDASSSFVNGILAKFV